MQLDNSVNSENQSKSQIFHEIRFRCPCCEKLYITQSDVFTASTGNDLMTNADPEFECQGCQSSFILSKNINSFGLFEAHAKSHTFSSCPKCHNLMPEQSKECPSCGVFVEKYQLMVQAESPQLFELNQAWAKVMTHFNHDQQHQDFINQCQQKTALSFAFQKYDELRKTMNYDAACEKYLVQIELRLEQQLQAKNAPGEINKKSQREKFSVVQWVFAGIGFVGLALLIFNKIKPTFPNLTGLVVSITVLSFGLWLFWSQNNSNIKL